MLNSGMQAEWESCPLVAVKSLFISIHSSPTWAATQPCTGDYLPNDRCSRSQVPHKECWAFCRGQRTKRISYLCSLQMQMHDVRISVWGILCGSREERTVPCGITDILQNQFCIRTATPLTSMKPPMAKLSPGYLLKPVFLSPWHLPSSLTCSWEPEAGYVLLLVLLRDGQVKTCIVRWPDVHPVQLCIHFTGKHTEERQIKRIL